MRIYLKGSSAVRLQLRLHRIATRRGSRARWKEGCATTGRLLLTETTRGRSHRIIHEPSREAEFNLALRQRSLEKKREKKRKKKGKKKMRGETRTAHEGRTLKGLQG